MDERKKKRVLETAQTNYKLATKSFEAGMNDDAMAYLIEILYALLPILPAKNVNEISECDKEITAVYQKAHALKKEITFVLREEAGKRI